MDSTKDQGGNDFHLKDVPEIVQQLNTNLQTGLSSSDVQTRIAEHGRNVFASGPAITWHQILAAHLFNFMNLVLLVAMILSFVVRSWIDAGVVALIIFTNTIIGFYQEFKSEKTMESLRQMSTPSCTVLRDGAESDIDSQDLVPGDIVYLKEGDSIPADGRVFEVVLLETDEALLTGESIPIKKVTHKLTSTEDISIGDRKNVVFMSSTVSKGKGKIIVTATGNDTEIGKIASTLSKGKKSKTPLQQRLDKLGFFLCGVAVLCIAIVLLTGWAYGTFDVYPEGLRVAVATAVAVIPQSIVVVVTLTLTVGVREMATRNALVRKLDAVETLGNITNICSDKTGTLTQGKMVATNVRLSNGQRFSVTGEGLIPHGEIKDEEGNSVDVSSNSVLSRLITVASLCNAASITKKEGEENSEKEEWIGIGSPTEVALIVLAHKVDMQKDKLTSSSSSDANSSQWKFMGEFPFDSSIKRMSTLYQETSSGDNILFLKGAPERVVSLCTDFVSDNDVHGARQPISEEIRLTIRQWNSEMAGEGLRVLALAFRDLGNSQESSMINTQADDSRELMEQECTFIGLIGVKDPPREKVPNAIRMCHKAGIAVHMVTGDHQFTAKAIAKQIGIFPKGLSEDQIERLVMTASQFDHLTDEELHNVKSLPLVIARCSPESKVRMVTELQRRGKRAVMMGDGVNDSPAIKLADVGMAMGLNGSDVTKEAADIVLLDDDFSTSVRAIEEGRRIFQNIRRFIIYLLTGNFAEATVLVVGIACTLDPPLTPMEILWINLVTSAPPAFVLGMVPAKPWYMDKNKRKVNEEFFTKETLFDIFFYGPLMGGLALVNFVIARFAFDQTLRRCQGATFAAITLMLMFHSYNCLNLRGGFWKKGFVTSYWLHLTVLFGIGSLFFTYYTPVFEDDVFEHKRPDWRNWLVAIATTVLFMFLSQIYKMIKRPFRKRSHKKDLQQQAEEDEYMIFHETVREV